ncbi:MAG: trimeric intracellular cation channel family protein [Gammaproteobacteria bacterium]|nr:trimeric intracellular cation channel family protein [Gammaproteobacteria bacterium]
MSLTYLLLQTGVAVFAITGVLAAARQNMDLLSLIVIGVVTAIGGGTLRDLMLDAPVFWLEDANYLYVSALAAIGTFVFEKRFRTTERALLYLDGVAAAVFAVLAAEKTLRLGFAPGVALVMGVITGIGGGLIRDVVTGHPTLLLRRELYMTPILAGGGLYLLLRGFTDLPLAVAQLAAMATITAVRSGAIRYDWEFPAALTYRALR